MKFAIQAFIVALSFIATASMSYAAGPYGSVSVGNWRGGAYTNEKTGAFANCAAGGPLPARSQAWLQRSSTR